MFNIISIWIIRVFYEGIVRVIRVLWGRIECVLWINNKEMVVLKWVAISFFMQSLECFEQNFNQQCRARPQFFCKIILPLRCSWRTKWRFICDENISKMKNARHCRISPLYYYKYRYNPLSLSLFWL